MEAQATVGVIFGGAAVAKVDYRGGELSGTASASWDAEISKATVAAALEVTASAYAAFVLTTSVYQALEIDVALRGSATFVGRGEAKYNVLTDKETLGLTKFDVDAVIDIPVVGRVPTIFFGGGQVDLGTLYSSTVPLLRLPTVSITTGGRATCNDDGDAELRLRVVTDTGDVLNKVRAPRDWYLDPGSAAGWSVRETDEDTLTFTKIGVSLLEGGLSNADVPTGTVDYWATPEIPPIPYALPETADLADVFRRAFSGIQCCVDEDCLDDGGDDGVYSCEASICLRNGNPRFAVSWVGDDDIDLHVMTPSGNIISWQSKIADGGALDRDDVPESPGSWVENIYWPLDGSAPPGTYKYWVHNYEQVGASDDWSLSAYEGSNLIFSYSGNLPNKGVSPTFSLDITSDDAD